jgi:CO/xanthine dehydrogenase FAD-binding subunit
MKRLTKFLTYRLPSADALAIKTVSMAIAICLLYCRARNVRLARKAMRSRPVKINAAPAVVNPPQI